MSKHSRNNKSERRAILWGYIYRYSVIAVLFLIVGIVFAIGELFQIENLGIILFLSLGITFILLGGHDIIGAILEWKYLLVSIQLYNRHYDSGDMINPRRAWTKYEKRQMIGTGIIGIILGIALTVITILAILGIL